MDDRALLRGSVLLAVIVAMIMFAMALALSERDLSIWTCQTTGANQYTCQAKGSG